MDSNEVASAFQNDSLGSDDAVGIAEKIKKGELSASLVTRDAIERAKAVNPKLNAITVENFDLAQTNSEKPFTGFFQGVPTFIKDTDEVPDLPLYLGSRSLPGEPSDKYSKAAKQIIDTGLNCLGTTTTPEFGLTGTTESLRFGATCNPSVSYTHLTLPTKLLV